MKCEKLLVEIDRLYEKYLSVWEDICNIESPTDCKEGVDKVGEYFIRLSEENGWTVKVDRKEKTGNIVYITMNPDADEKPVSISGHIDTVHPIGSFGTPAVHMDETNIYGPGVTDCKGGVVAGFMAMEALKNCGFDSRPIRMILQSDEEFGSSDIESICEYAKDSIAFLNLEGNDKGKACIERKGIITFTFTVYGVEAHSSKCAIAGSNAILEAAHKIIELEKIKDKDGLTCCCSVISGGTTVNTVPGVCEFKANVRFATNEQAEHMRKYAEEIAQKTYVEGCTCKLTYPKGRPAMELNKRNKNLLEKMNRIYAENGLPILEPSKRTGGSDAANISAFGIPVVDSVGVNGGNIHSKNEYAVKKSLVDAAKRVASVIWYIK